MKILIACEESQAITIKFRKAGFECYSCDIQQCSGNYPEFHIINDAINEAYSGKYILMIAHPPCTYLSNAGAPWLFRKGQINEERYKNGLKAKNFFLKLLNAPIRHIAIENPTPSKIYDLPKHSQVIQPYMFGDGYSKRTLLWLKNLPYLLHNDSVNLFDDIVTHIKEYQPFINGGGGRINKENYKGKKFANNSKSRSKTFPGIAQAIVDQWGNFLKSTYQF